MNNNQIEALLREIKLKGLDADDAGDYEVSETLTAARKAIQTWQKNGRSGSLPYQKELTTWGILEAAVSEGEPADSMSDEERALMQAYEDAQAMLNNGRFHSARNAFHALQTKVESGTPLAEKVNAGYDTAARKLDQTITPLIEKANQYSQTHSDDLDKQRDLWGEVLQKDPDNTIAKQALQTLETEGDRVRIEKEMVRIAQSMQMALDKSDLHAANRQLGAIQGLAADNNFDDLQLDLDDLVRDLTKDRNDLRQKLGAASTLSVTGDTREAYRQAREFMNAGVPVMIDAGGLFGLVDAEVDTIQLFAETRRRFLSSLISLTQQRRQLADEQKQETPVLAKKTLENALDLLDDDLLAAEDHDELKDTRQGIENELAKVEERLRNHEKARELVLLADEPGVSFEDKLKLYREAKEIYAEYRNLDNYIEETQDALAAQLAGRVKDMMTQIRIDLSRDEFEKALTGVKETRAKVYAEVPQPKAGSELVLVLAGLEQLNQEIIEADGEHHTMMKLLSEVDGLLDQYVEAPDPNLLGDVRQLLDSLPSTQAQHQQVRQRRLRLTSTQGDRENWRQGMDAYRIREWADAQTFLQQVADSPNATNQAEAERLTKRAQAALYTEEARHAELERNWRRAIDRYKEANRLFDEYGSDSQTNLLHDDCRDKLDSLKPLEENDQRVRHVISQAESLVREGQQSVQVRRSALERVEPVSQFKKAVEKLLEVRQQDTTLTAELERTLRDGREAWRKTYLEGMSQAVRSKDVIILQKAVERGEDLQEQNLLYEAADKQLLQKLQEQLLDTEYANLKAEKTASPTLLEQNRHKRWQIANPKTDELYEQYQSAMENRVLLELSEEQGKSSEAALQYLKEEMRRPELYQSERLFREFMHLCWGTGNWQDASRQAESLAYRAHVVQATEKSTVWGGLTEAAKLLDRGSLPSFEAELQGLKHVSQRFPDLDFLIEDERKWLTNWRLERLIREAQTAANSQDEQELIKAAQLFAEAHELNERDNRVQTGLQSLGRKLNNSLEIYAGQAQNINIRKSLAESIRRAEDLIFILQSIQKVQAVLNLKQETQEALTDGREHIQGKLTPWKKVQAQFERLDKAKIDYLTYPEPMRPDGEGGWRVRELVDQSATLLQIAQGDRELIQLINTKRETFTDLDNKAEELNQQVHQLAQAIQAESFSEVLSAANQLERLWNRYQDEGFSGLDILVRHRYPYTEKEVRQLREHKSEAKIQQANLEEWLNWAEQVELAYRDVKAVGSRIDKHLDDLRLEQPLYEIQKSCDLVLEKTAVFEEALERVPDSNPMSQKAAEAQDQVDETWRGEVLDNVNSYQNRASELLAQIEDDLANFAKPLRQMRQALDLLNMQIQQHEESKNSRFRREKPFPTAQLRNATKRLKACQEIDPSHDEVVTVMKKLREINRKYGES